MVWRERILATLIGLLAVGVFLTDLYLLPEAILPAAPYAVPVLIAAYLLSAPMTVAIAALSTGLVVLSAAIDQSGFLDWFPQMLGLVIVGFLAAALSIRSRREAAATARADAAAREREAERARLETVLQQMPSGVVIAEAPSGRLIFGNRQTERIFGRPFMPSSSVAEYREWSVHRLDGRPYAPEEIPLARSLTGEVVAGEEIRILRGDGSPGVVRVNSAPIRDEKGLIVAALAALDDVTEEKRAEEALRESEGRFRALSEATFEGIAIHEGGLVLEVNEAFARMFGYETREVIGMSGLETVAPESRESVREHILAGFEQPYETTGLRKDGTTFPMEVHGKETTYKGRRVRVVAARDITERKRVEQFREEYVSLISHDLRTPLTAAMAQIQVIQRRLTQRGLADEARSAEVALRNARKMASMIEELVESARLESGQLALRLEATDLCRLLTSAVERVAGPDDGTRLRLDCPGELRLASIDRERVERAVVNLIANALKYSPPNSPVLVRIARRDGEAIISVSDQGPGIPAEDQSRLFARFYRTPTARGSEGLGLGLYITRLIVEAHGGRIWVDSEPGKGATFSLTLPLTAG